MSSFLLAIIMIKLILSFYNHMTWTNMPSRACTCEKNM